MKILVTGAAGFIGFHLSKKLLENGHEVIGLDNLNDYYAVDLKFARLNRLGIAKKMAQHYGTMSTSSTQPAFKFIKLDIGDRDALPRLFEQENIKVVCNLAAQAGVRYSLENPEAYVDSNIVGFLNLLECCRNHGIEHLVYASSSSVYGLNKEMPFKVTQNVDNPISLYAASKKSNELMAHTYSHLFGLRTTGLRFFTVYGPWGRPDMAMFLFTKAILEDRPIHVFNNGDLERDFTYIDDIIQGIVRIVEDNHTAAYNSKEAYHLYNIGNSKPVRLLDFIEALENNLEKKAIKEMKPMQPGDVKSTWADVSGLEKDYEYRPNTPIDVGVAKFTQWYKDHYLV
ncbi:NAD-dependent epimerase [Flagellimonas taeanensis]|uniref:NAD-dependent epimerase n=1 Tax=Flavobacteriaceae TaxID=49546 RepID=UPI000E69FA99|nr:MULTISPECIES: NAD-dependent epimerase [Allomuricauda]MDC6385724.1 NAD-dependent epimerase [Muricauda sp. SK9]RIV50986.1 NAD-dependent epimerase [Allomuricauda taeanensis]